MSRYKDVSVDRLKQLFQYDYCTGVLYWRWRPENDFATPRAHKIWNKRFSGKEAGTKHVSKKSSSVYKMTKLLGNMTLVHLIVWAMHYGAWPSESVDHIDRVGTNNTISNLRLANQSEQLKNRNLSKNSTSGVKGVNYHKVSGKWVARINDAGVTVNLGFYKDFDAAVEARRAAEVVYRYSPQEVI